MPCVRSRVAPHAGARGVELAVRVFTLRPNAPSTRRRVAAEVPRRRPGGRLRLAPLPADRRASEPATPLSRIGPALPLELLGRAGMIGGPRCTRRGCSSGLWCHAPVFRKRSVSRGQKLRPSCGPAIHQRSTSSWNPFGSTPPVLSANAWKASIASTSCFIRAKIACPPARVRGVSPPGGSASTSSSLAPRIPSNNLIASAPAPPACRADGSASEDHASSAGRNRCSNFGQNDDGGSSPGSSGSSSKSESGLFVAMASGLGSPGRISKTVSHWSTLLKRWIKGQDIHPDTRWTDAANRGCSSDVDESLPVHRIVSERTPVPGPVGAWPR